MIEIALVEDNASISKIVAGQLGRMGFSVTTFSTADAFLAAERGRFAVVLVDLQLIGSSMDGLTLIRHLSPDRRCIALTAGDAGMRAQAISAGAFATFDKPLDVEALVKAIVASTGQEAGS